MKLDVSRSNTIARPTSGAEVELDVAMNHGIELKFIALEAALGVIEFLALVSARSPRSDLALFR
jgi:hypothetical protein